MPGDAVYVYGVSPRTGHDVPPIPGVENGELNAVEHGELVALTSRLHGGRLAARDVRAHWRVLEQAFERTTVVPVRFGTVLESEDAVRERLLEPNAERLSTLLEELRGLIQLTVRGRYDEDVLLRQILVDNPMVARLRDRLAPLPAGAAPSEQIRLGQLVENEVARCRERDAGLALESLGGVARASRAEEVAHPAAFDLAFLVERESEPAFGAAVHALREQFGTRIEIRYIGPLPPFSFAHAELGGGGGAWV